MPAKRKSTRKPRRKTVKKSLFKRVLPVFIWLVVLLALVMVYWVSVLNQRVKSGFDQPYENVPSHVYGRDVSIKRGQVLPSNSLQSALKARGYKAVKKLSGSHQFAVHKSIIDISLSEAALNYQTQAAAVRIQLSGNTVRQILDHKTGEELKQARLEPVLISSLSDSSKKDKLLLRLDQAPEMLITALLLMEDRRFFEHSGIDPIGIARAFGRNLMQQTMHQGGSTLTQQLVKNIYLDSSRTLKRKANEAVMALLVEAHFSKEAILERYLNTLFLGQQGNRAIHGFNLAAQFYFGKSLGSLSTGEISTLVGIVPAPSAFNPFRNPERATQRRNTVLRKLMEAGEISEKAYQKASKQKLVVTKSKKSLGRYPVLADFMEHQLSESGEAALVGLNGLNFYSTLDADLQSSAQTTLSQQLDKLEKNHQLANGRLQGAMLVINPKTGAILAAVGGREKHHGASFNRALTARRPIGSLIKPAVYLSALQQPSRYSLGTPVANQALQLKMNNGEVWAPQNYNKTYSTSVDVYSALVKSMNVPTVNIGLDVGLDTVVKQLKTLGITAPVKPYPSLLLGATSLNLMQVTQLYQSLANGGVLHPLHSLNRLSTDEGELIYQYAEDGQRVISANNHYLIQYALHGVTQNGTARSLKNSFPNTALAGKTGTTDDYRDSWFAGYSGNLLTVVWVGNDDNLPIKLSGASGALKVWSAFMREHTLSPINLTQPSGIEIAHFDRDNGTEAVKNCSQNTAYLPVIVGYGPGPNPNCKAKLKQVLDSDWWSRLFSSSKDTQKAGSGNHKPPVVDIQIDVHSEN